MNDHLLDSMRELHSRINDGIHVRLLWRKDDDRVVVAVDDARTGDSFVLDVKPRRERHGRLPSSIRVRRLARHRDRFRRPGAGMTGRPAAG